MQLVFSCPECSSGAVIDLSEEEVEAIKKTILENGRSPTLLSTCENGHELIVTLYFRDDKLGVRDIAVPIGNGRKKKEPEKKLSGELDWVKDVFGG
jgi:hypothetical protein